MKYLDLTGVGIFWNKVKEYVKNNVVDKYNKANGIAALDASGKLLTSVLPAFKTVNGISVVGDGNISIDLSLYKVVTELPTSNIDTTKVYLKLDTNGKDSNVYIEYIYVNGAWEKLGEYKAEVDLSNYVSFDDAATAIKNGAMSKEDKTKLDNIETITEQEIINLLV